MSASIRSTLGKMRRRIVGDRGGVRRDLLPPASRLDQLEELSEYDIGRYTWGHLTVSYRTPGCTLRVGNFSSFAYGCRVILGGEHRMDFVTTYRFPAYPPFSQTHGHLRDAVTASRGDVTIGNDVWVGHDALILSGVTLGDGAVVGAGSVVRQSIPPYAVAIGNPARVTGFRFTPEQIEALLRIRWWDWTDARITESLDLLLSPDIQHFIDKHDVEDLNDQGPVGGKNG